MVIDKIVIDIQAIADFTKIDTDRVFQKPFEPAFVANNGTTNQEHKENRGEKPLPNINIQIITLCNPSLG